MIHTTPGDVFQKSSETTDEEVDYFHEIKKNEKPEYTSMQ